MVKIFIEGKSKRVPESDFLRTILSRIGIADDRYELVHTDGYTNLLSSRITTNIELMRANTDIGGKNLVIFDADSAAANGGGFAVRRDALVQQRDALGLAFELFLCPNNHDDGNVEVLMESIARKDLYPDFFDCFSKYEHCMSQRKDDKGEPYYSIPNRKGKLHTYFNALPISNTKKKSFGSGSWRWDDADIWNLDAESLNPIKEFLLQNI